jgi:shikimate dehydrogenase
MHEREAAAQSLLYLYRPLDLTTMNRPAADVGELLRGARDLGYNALNITHPCKQLVLDHLDEVADDAAELGAVNTVLIKDGRFEGHNTDGSGFASGMHNVLPDVALDRVVQVGAGGAGAAVAHALLASGVKHLLLIDLDPARAAERAAALSAIFAGQTVEACAPADIGSELAEADGVVHATPVGMYQHPGTPFDTDLLEPRHWVADVVYRPVDTELIQVARAKGCKVLDGGHMAVGQAIDAFRLITGREPDAARMRAHFLEMLARGL